MQRFLLLLCAIVILAMAVGTAWGSISVKCKGKACGESGKPDGGFNEDINLTYSYAYEVVVLDEEFDWFRVGVGANASITNIKAYYFNNENKMWLASTNFTGQIRNNDHESTHDPMTAHGNTTNSNGSTSTCVVWSGSNRSGSFWFVFNSPNSPMDVGWMVELDETPKDQENWAQPVGKGEGPVHGPVSGALAPEPMSVILAALGLSSVALLRRRRT